VLQSNGFTWTVPITSKINGNSENSRKVKQASNFGVITTSENLQLRAVNDECDRGNWYRSVNHFIQLFVSWLALFIKMRSPGKNWFLGEKTRV